MYPAGDYYTLMRESKDPKYLRLRMVQHARQQGVEPMPRAFQASPNTVRKCLRRFDGSLSSLADRSRAPQHHPHRLPLEAEARILQAQRQLPVYGARKLKQLAALPYAVKTIKRVLRQHGPVRLPWRWRTAAANIGLFRRGSIASRRT